MRLCDDDARGGVRRWAILRVGDRAEAVPNKVQRRAPALSLLFAWQDEAFSSENEEDGGHVGEKDGKRREK